MRGVYAIPVTPFLPNGNIDLFSLKRCVDFCVESGAHGIVSPVNASEFTSLNDSERKQVIQTIVQATEKRIPVVAGVAGVSADHAAEFASFAHTVGADAVIAMPPYVRQATNPEIRIYYERIAASAQVPVFIQNYRAPIGTPLSASFINELLTEIENINFVKEETLLATHLISEIRGQGGDKLKGIMGGMGGRHLINEYKRGICGTMPACEIVDLHVMLWNALESQDNKQARHLYNRLLPLLNLESLYGAAIYKEILWRRGIINHPIVRDVGYPTLDDYDRQELDLIFEELADLITDHPYEPYGAV